MEIPIERNKDEVEQLEKFLKVLQSVDHRSVNIECWYQELLENPNRTEGEELLFKTMENYRSSVFDFFETSKMLLDKFGLPKKHSTYDWDSRPINYWEYVFKLNFMPRHVAETEIKKYRLSTVWLGLNHTFWDGPLTIFETMIFSDDDEFDDDEIKYYQLRYATLQEAEAGHQEAVDFLNSKVKSR